MTTTHEQKIIKNCWVKKTEYKFLGKKIFECFITCDQSEFQKPQSDNTYLIPDCFKGDLWQ